jgi:hypothetical protein
MNEGRIVGSFRRTSSVICERSVTYESGRARARAAIRERLAMQFDRPANLLISIVAQFGLVQELHSPIRGDEVSCHSANRCPMLSDGSGAAQANYIEGECQKLQS